MLGLFGHKKRENQLRQEVHESFGNVKRDFNKVGEWIKHLDDKHASHKNEIESIKDQLLDIQDEIMEIKDYISFFGPQTPSKMSKQQQTVEYKQTMSGLVQTDVQTDVQTNILNNLTVMERAIIWALINSELKLSYEDLAALLGKDKSTIRGQINTIKQKNEHLIEEFRESNGKKRLYIPDDIKEKIIKGVKLKVKQKKTSKN